MQNLSCQSRTDHASCICMYVSDTLLGGIIWSIKASVFLGSFNLNYSAHFQCAWMQIAKDPETLTALITNLELGLRLAEI